MRNTVFQELIGTDGKAFPLIKAGRIGLYFGIDLRGHELLTDLADSLFQKCSAKSGSMLHCQDPAKLNSIRIFPEGAQISEHLPLFLVEYMQAIVIFAIQILIYTVLQ